MELYGVELKRFEEDPSLLEGLDPRYYDAWIARHGEKANERVRRAGLGGLRLLQSAGYLGELIYDANGRPSLVGAEIDFNITHTEHYAFCAIAQKGARVGLDAEEARRMSTLRSFALAERWFVDGERRAFAKEPTVDCFLRIWTRKEALLKWTGEGLRAVMREDTTDAEMRHGVKFYDFSEGGIVLTLCCDASAEPPTGLIWRA